MKRLHFSMTGLTFTILLLLPSFALSAPIPPYPQQLEETRWTNDAVKPLKKVLSKKDYTQVSGLLKSIGDDMKEAKSLQEKIDWNNIFDVGGWASVERRGKSLTKKDYDFFRKKVSVDMLNEHVMPAVRKAQAISGNAKDLEKIISELKGNYKKSKDVEALETVATFVDAVKVTSQALQTALLDSDDAFIEEGIVKFQESEAKRKKVIADNLDKFLTSGINKGKDFVAEVKKAKTAGVFNKKIKDSVRDITQNLANVVKYKIYEDLGKPSPEGILSVKQIEDWRDEKGKLPENAAERDVLEALAIYEDFLSKVEAWYR